MLKSCMLPSLFSRRRTIYYQLHFLQHIVHFFKLIWNSAIPLSRLFFLWRISQGKLPTDDNLMKRGCIIVSMCSLCGFVAESTTRLFLHCSFAQGLWDWLSAAIKIRIDLSSYQFMELPSEGCLAHCCHQHVLANLALQK